ncbi:hypothetical protein AwErysi_00770 [Erysipelotrichaceae bacterium]|nr:hypothetical protein AwErysi_00770 [Erysipelotrichaceae bacterium]
MDDPIILKKILKKNPYLLIEELMRKQAVLQLSPAEFLVLQFLWIELAELNSQPSNEHLSQITGMEIITVRQAIFSLIEKKYLGLNTVQIGSKIAEVYDMDLLIQQLYKLKHEGSKVGNQLQHLVKMIELEFARQLSPIEIQCIQGWVYDEKIEVVVIEEALKETILAGVRNFKYMSAIIHNWQKTGEKKYGIQNQKLEMAKKFVPTKEQKDIAAYDWTKNLGEDDV